MGKMSFFRFFLPVLKMGPIRKWTLSDSTVCYNTQFMWKFVIFTVFPSSIQNEINLKSGTFGPRSCAIGHSLCEKRSFFGFTLLITKMEEIRKKKYFQALTVCYNTLFMWKMIIFWVFPSLIENGTNLKSGTSGPRPCAIEYSLCEKRSFFFVFSLDNQNGRNSRKKYF